MGFEGSPRPSNERRGNKSSEDILLLNTTNRTPVALVGGAIVHVVVVVDHEPVVSVASGVLRSRPPVALVAGTVETAAGGPAAARQGRKSVLISTANTAITIPSR